MVLPEQQLFNANYSKSFKNYVTAHKISLLVLLKEFCYVKHHNIRKRINQVLSDEVSWEHNSHQNRDFSATFLKLIQNPDVDLQSLINIIHPIMHPKTYQLFIDRLNTIRKNGIAALLDFFGTLDSLLIEAAPLVPVIQKSSVLGLFVRHMLLAFDKLTFSLQTKLCRKFQFYFDAAFEPCVVLKRVDDIDVKDEDEESPSDEVEILASQRQAEFFIAQQAALLQVNEHATLSPVELQQKIKELVKGNPDLHEACFLSYMNSMRVKEYCGAKENLYWHYDRNTAVPQDCKSSNPSEDLTRSSRYAALNLAIMHAMFGHKQQALVALNEAIMLAQEVNDNICLQFALSWLYRLTDNVDDKEAMIERSIAKAIDLGLWSLSSLGIQALSKLKSETTEKPTSVLETLGRSDIQNCQHSMTEMMGPAYMMRAGLWNYYGNSKMGTLLTQALLYLNTSDPNYLGVVHIGEGVCLALRGVSLWLAAHGFYLEAAQVLNLACELFPPNTAFSQIWQLAEQIILFEKSFYRGKWHLALKAATGIAIFDNNEGRLRKAQLFIQQENIHEAETILKKLIRDMEESQHVSPHFYVRTLLLQAELFTKTPNKEIALPLLMTCLAICRSHHLLGLECFTTIQIAEAVMELGLPRQAWILLTKIQVAQIVHGTDYDRGCCYYVCARSIIAQALKHMRRDAHRSKMVMLFTLRFFDTAIWYFKRVQATLMMKKVLAYKARSYNVLGMRDHRNHAAHRYRYVEDEFVGWY